jgi:ribosomal protein S19E (S16A)
MGTVITGLFKLLRDNTRALERVAIATETGAQEAKERNGHLADQGLKVAQISKQSVNMSRKILERLEKSEVRQVIDTEKVRTDLMEAA